VQNTRPDRQSSLFIINDNIFAYYMEAMLFSATFKGKVEKLARECLTDPVRIVIGDVGEVIIIIVIIKLK
jgi:hypothetical protein